MRCVIGRSESRTSSSSGPRKLEEASMTQVIDAIDRLADAGPALGRPLVDRLTASNIHNLKESGLDRSSMSRGYDDSADSSPRACATYRPRDSDMCCRNPPETPGAAVSVIQGRRSELSASVDRPWPPRGTSSRCSSGLGLRAGPWAGLKLAAMVTSVRADRAPMSPGEFGESLLAGGAGWE